METCLLGYKDIQRLGENLVEMGNGSGIKHMFVARNDHKNSNSISHIMGVGWHCEFPNSFPILAEQTTRFRITLVMFGIDE